MWPRNIQNGCEHILVLWDLNPTRSATRAIALPTRPHHPIALPTLLKVEIEPNQSVSVSFVSVTIARTFSMKIYLIENNFLRQNFNLRLALFVILRKDIRFFDYIGRLGQTIFRQ